MATTIIYYQDSTLVLAETTGGSGPRLVVLTQVSSDGSLGQSVVVTADQVNNIFQGLQAFRESTPSS